MSRHYSRSKWSGWSELSLRFVATLVVFALAGLSGAVIAGVGVYLINDAVAPPPSADANGKNTLTLVDKPSPAASSNSAPAATEMAVQPRSDGAASSAASQNQPKAPQAPVAVQPQSSPVSPAAPHSGANARVADEPQQSPAARADDKTQAGKAQDETGTETGAARTPTGNPRDYSRKGARKRVTATTTRQPGPQASEEAQSADRRPYYDYYNRGDEQWRNSANGAQTTERTRPDSRTRRGFSQSQERVQDRNQERNGVRRQANSNDWGDGDRDQFQSRRPQSSFGFFGGDRRDNWHDNWRDDDRD